MRHKENLDMVFQYLHLQLQLLLEYLHQHNKIMLLLFLLEKMYGNLLLRLLLLL